MSGDKEEDQLNSFFTVMSRFVRRPLDDDELEQWDEQHDDYV